MATATIYQPINTGYQLQHNDPYGSGGDYEVSRPTGNIDSYIGGTNWDGKRLTAAWQKFLTFDVSSVSGTTISSADLVFTIDYIPSYQTNYVYYAYAKSWTDGSDAVATGNWVEVGAVSGLTQYAATANTAPTVNADFTFTGNASLRSAVSAGSAALKMVTMSQTFALQQDASQGMIAYVASSANTQARYPRLVVTYTSGGAALTRTTAETVTASDSLTRSTTRPRGATDALTSSDALARSGARSRAAADVVAVSDAVAGVYAPGHNDLTSAASDALTVADAASRATALIRAVSDSLTAADAAARVLAVARQIVDSVALVGVSAVVGTQGQMAPATASTSSMTTATVAAATMTASTIPAATMIGA